MPDVELSQQTTLSGTGETTVITADPAFRRNLAQLIVTTTNAAAGTLTLRDSTGGTVRAIFDYPAGSAAPGAPLIVSFQPVLQQTAGNNNWTLQASLNGSGYHVLASFVTGN